jgi:uroporphyrin-III C-methyltransferase/precorrin-2 dehydrogenase/sirohydrochlorin ferrochelatase
VTGFVWLVGAGPGDPELLTRKAARCLAEADLVLYDALVCGETLALAPRAQRFCVGKRAGRPGVPQETIHTLMVRAARRGRRVVRLKCGDPFVLGRGGEEALALRAAGVPYEVVPGLTSAAAAPALAGIPLTHRGLASAFVVLSAHDEASYRRVLEGLAPGSVTVVALMGLRNRRALALCLLGRGWPPRTPAAIVWGAATSRCETWLGTLAGLAADHRSGLPSAPATIVVGTVVSVAARPGDARWGADVDAFIFSGR